MTMESIPADLEATDLHGEPVRLVELAKDRPVLLVFIRHFG